MNEPRMAAKTCSIERCGSSSTREEDIGVTYLKFPKDPSVRELWVSVTRLKNSDQPQPIYVCSRHFCKKDFEKQDSKYVLKSDAVPSIFSWNMEQMNKSLPVTNMDIDLKIELQENEKQEESLDNSKESEVENVDAIKEFIAAQEQEIANAKAVKEKALDDEVLEPSDTTKPSDKNIENLQVATENESESQEKQDINKIICEDVSMNEDNAMADAAHVIDMILTETEAKIAADITSDQKTDKPAAKQIMSMGAKGNTMALSVGSKVEARDFSEDWHPAQILEVDFEEMEVLVHYEVANKKPDEWISVSSPRLRPEGTGPLKASSPVPDEPEPEPETPEKIKEEIKHEEKNKLAFEVGERCLARWRDNRRFMATISSDLGEGIYEILFDDGARWSCNTSRLHKLKDSTVYPENLTPIMSIPSPGPVPSGSQSAPLAQLPLYHTHLFDPTRDYLGSKSERREKKRKLNIKEIFNIGQKKVKKMETPKTSRPKTPTKPKPKVVKKRLDLRSDVKKETEVKNIVTEIKKELPSSPAIKKELPSSPAIKKSLPSSPVIKELPSSPVMKELPSSPAVNVLPSSPAIKKELPSSPAIKKELLSSPAFKKKIPEAIASIRGTPKEAITDESKEMKQEIKEEIPDTPEKDEASNMMEVDDLTELANSETLSAPESLHMKLEEVEDIEEEAKLEKFEQTDNDQNGEVIDRIKEVITKLEDGLSEMETKSDIMKYMESPKVVIKEDDIILADLKPTVEDKTKNLAKVKKSKKLRLLQEKKVQKQVEKVKCELEVMKKQMEEMKKAMLLKTEEIAQGKGGGVEMPESLLLPGEWCCKWMNGQPVGTVSEMESDVRVGADNRPALPRRSVQVEDKRLPEGWTKHMVRRSFGNSAGKWDVVLVSPDNRRFHTKTEMRHYFEHNPSMAEALEEYQKVLYDFGVHLKLSRRMGWYTITPDGELEPPAFTLPAGTLVTTSPLVKRPVLGLNKREKEKLRREKNKARVRSKPKLSKSLLMKAYANYPSVIDVEAVTFEDPVLAGPSVPSEVPSELPAEPQLDIPLLEPLEDGCVYVGSLKVQILENLLRCPAEGCFKNFRNNTLLKMHIKHYHRELVKELGATPKVLDLAYARTRPSHIEMRKLKLEAQRKTIKVKMPRFQKRPLVKSEAKDVKLDPNAPVTPIKKVVAKIPRSQDSPKLRSALGKHIRRPKVLLPVRRPVNELLEEQMNHEVNQFVPLEPKEEVPMEPLDFETAISTHTVTKPAAYAQKKRQSLASASQLKMSEEEEWMGSDPDTRSSYPRSGTPDSKNMDQKHVSSESNEEQKDNYWYTETGERIKIVHMKREEIINCHCGFREEDGLMVQCELCLCWQHALCHNIQREADVPEKYTCSICLNPRRGRRSQRFLHDQDRLYEGLLPGAKPCESLRRSHELSGNLIRIQDALHALRVKYFVAAKKDHPKLYLWAKDWETGELSVLQEKLNSDYSDLNIMINSIGKENLPIKDDIKDMHIDPSSEDHDIESGQRYGQKDSQLGSQALLSGLLSSPGAASLDLPISTQELERLASTVQEEAQRVIVPQPEAAIENSACRERLLRHIQRCQALVDARLDSIEAQVAELESQDPSFEDDETADFFPRTKQTVQMMMRDLDTMEELGVIT